MRVLVTGGVGFIGSYTADLLLKKGYSVRILDNLEKRVHQQKLVPDDLLKNAEFVLGDVRDSVAVRSALAGVDAVIHLAAYQDYLIDFSKFAFTNDGGTALLYEAIVSNHLPVRKVVLGSSQSVYGEGTYACVEHGIQYPQSRSLEQLLVAEWEISCPACGRHMKPLAACEARVNPQNQYAVSKYSQELYAMTLGKRYGIPTVVLRYSITQGPRQSFFNAYSGILRSFTIRLLNDQPPVVYEDGGQLRDYVYVEDVAKANLLALESNVSFEAFNVGGNNVITVLEYANLLSRVLGKEFEPLVLGEFRYGDSRHIISDTTKLQELGWLPETPLAQIVAKYVAWIKEQPGVLDYYSQAAKVMREKGVLRLANP